MQPLTLSSIALGRTRHQGMLGSTTALSRTAQPIPAVRTTRAMMREHPLLIRRPLMELGEVRQAGFIPGPVTQALGLVMEPEQDLQSCPMDKPQPECGAPA